ncbi:hypothetical protein G2912_28280 [Paraburkholderia aspalathi]|uniref:hypothetical protein n=1 Tax=Paraburkholderia nemoris TaxID=2793076 RepID=UPI00190D2248|nr:MULTISPECIES: hypothetical protein [Paraburkholderia]MBK3814258.1 hypothetical protein [Paraburkholderia aspalathi]
MTTAFKLKQTFICAAQAYFDARSKLEQAERVLDATKQAWMDELGRLVRLRDGRPRRDAIARRLRHLRAQRRKSRAAEAIDMAIKSVSQPAQKPDPEGRPGSTTCFGPPRDHPGRSKGSRALKSEVTAVTGVTAIESTTYIDSGGVTGK